MVEWSTTPSCGKTKDPGNEVGGTADSVFTFIDLSHKKKTTEKKIYITSATELSYLLILLSYLGHVLLGRCHAQSLQHLHMRQATC